MTAGPQVQEKKTGDRSPRRGAGGGRRIAGNESDGSVLTGNSKDVVDLSHDLQEGMPLYPGSVTVSVTPTATISKDGKNMVRLTLGSHAGTHIDAPSHFIEGGQTIDTIPASRFMGEAVVVDLSSKPTGRGITAEDLRERLEGVVEPDDIVLLYTGWSEHWGDDTFLKEYTYLTGDGANFLVSKRVRAVGTDAISIEKFGAKTPIAHRILLGSGVYIVETLASSLRKLVGRRVLFIGLPVKVKNGDAGPCRAVALPLG